MKEQSRLPCRIFCRLGIRFVHANPAVLGPPMAFDRLDLHKPSVVTQWVAYPLHGLPAYPDCELGVRGGNSNDEGRKGEGGD